MTAENRFFPDGAGARAPCFNEAAADDRGKPRAPAG